MINARSDLPLFLAFAVASCGVVGCAGDQSGPTGGGDGGAANEGPFDDRGVPGCGLEQAAFCATFDEVTGGGPEGRSAELSGERWSGERMVPGVGAGAAASRVGSAMIPACRGGLPARAFPGQDFLVCDPNASIQSRHLLMLAAEQNYGQASLRIRQRIDFTEGNRRIVFDADSTPEALLGWISVAITETPSPAPSFGQQQNFENGAIPRRGVEVHFFASCNQDGQVGVGLVTATDEWVERLYSNSSGGAATKCVRQQAGAMNHFELRLSRDHLEVWATDASSDGISFGAPIQLFALDLALPFTRGYVHLNTHNHASLKYSEGASDAWISRWDNVGFDGPIVDNGREYSIADSMAMVEDGVNVGYQVGAAEDGPTDTLRFRGVDVSNVEEAHLSLNATFLPYWNDAEPATCAYRYRLNGGPFGEHRFTGAELAFIEDPTVLDETGKDLREAQTHMGTVSLWLPLDPTALAEGDNTLELVTAGCTRSYPPSVANIDLVLKIRP